LKYIKMYSKCCKKDIIAWRISEATAYVLRRIEGRIKIDSTILSERLNLS